MGYTLLRSVTVPLVWKDMLLAVKEEIIRDLQAQLEIKNVSARVNDKKIAYGLNLSKMQALFLWELLNDYGKPDSFKRLIKLTGCGSEDNLKKLKEAVNKKLLRHTNFYCIVACRDIDKQGHYRVFRASPGDRVKRREIGSKIN